MVLTIAETRACKKAIGLAMDQSRLEKAAMATHDDLLSVWDKLRGRADKRIENALRAAMYAINDELQASAGDGHPILLAHARVFRRVSAVLSHVRGLRPGLEP